MPTVEFTPTEDGDAYIVHSSSGTTWSDIRGSAGEANHETATTVEVSILSGNTSNRWASMFRGIVFFDTSSIPDDATITSAKISFVGTGKDNQLATLSLHVCGNDSSGTTIIKNSDYQDTRGTSYGSISYADFNDDASTYSEITLNASGLAWIKKTSITRFTFRTSADMLNTAPAWSGGLEISWFAFASKEATGDRAPILAVTYSTTPPIVVTVPVGGITSTSAFGNGDIMSTGGEGVDEQGIVYSTSTHAAPGNVAPASSGYESVVNETGTFGVGTFTEQITGLTAQTTYYLRAYAHNAGGGYAYGDEVSFITSGSIPTVTTSAVTDNTALTTATGNGDVTDDGGLAITERGIVWSTSPTPTTSSNKVVVAGTTGSFSGSLTGLLGGTLYYVRAYAINALGTAYGSQVTFTSVDFLNPANAYADDATYMTAQADTGAINISLSGDAGATYSAVVSSTYTSSETVNTFGLGATELWGGTWTGDNVSDANFRLKISVGTNPAFHLYKDFGFSPSSSLILTGIEVAINAKWDGAVTSIDHIKIKIHYGTSLTQVSAGAQAFATDGGADGLGALMIYNGTTWNAAGEGEVGDALTASDIGVLVQAYDTDLTAWAGKTAPSGTVVGHTDTQTLTNKTINGLDNTITNVNPGMWKNPYCFRAYDSAGTTLTDGSVVIIALGTEEYDYNSNFGVNTYTVPVAGVYHFDAALEMTGAASPVFAQLRVYKNGVIALSGQRFVPGSGATAFTVSGDLLLAATDAITLRFVQDSGGNETSVTGSDATYLSGHLVHQT